MGDGRRKKCCFCVWQSPDRAMTFAKKTAEGARVDLFLNIRSFYSKLGSLKEAFFRLFVERKLGGVFSLICFFYMLSLYSSFFN